MEIPQPLLNKMNNNVKELENIIKELKQSKLTDLQEALDWIDSINKLSVEF